MSGRLCVQDVDEKGSETGAASTGRLVGAKREKERKKKKKEGRSRQAGAENSSCYERAIFATLLQHKQTYKRQTRARASPSSNFLLTICHTKSLVCF